MWNRTISDAVRAVQIALRFTSLVRRRAALVDEASAGSTVADGMMQQAYAEATTSVAAKRRTGVRAPAKVHIA